MKFEVHPFALPPARSYRVEHCTGNQKTVLAHLDDAFPHHATLTPFVTHLHLDGRAIGELRLIDAATGALVARRDLGRPLRRRPNVSVT